MENWKKSIRGGVQEATAERAGIVKLCSLTDVTDSTGKALPASEKNPAVEGSLANLMQEGMKTQDINLTFMENSYILGNYSSGFLTGNAGVLNCDIYIENASPYVLIELLSINRTLNRQYRTSILTSAGFSDVFLDTDGVLKLGTGTLSGSFNSRFQLIFRLD